jgi:hypothetical protein
LSEPASASRRSRRHLPIRSRTISIKRLTKRELELGRLMYPEESRDERPKTRGECLQMERPCCFVSCKYHLFLDVTQNGSIRLNFPDREIEDMPETCALDVADQDGMTLEDVGELLNVTRERIRMIEVQALAKVFEQQALDAHSEHRDETKRRAFTSALKGTAA